MCDDNVHKHQIGTFCNDIINSCIDTRVDTIPLRKKYNDQIVGSNGMVKPEREHSVYWNVACRTMVMCMTLRNIPEFDITML